MAKEDFILREEMGRLEIEPSKVISCRKNENPFKIHKKAGSQIKTTVFNAKSSCPFDCHKKNKNDGIFKKKRNKILKEPILCVLKTCVNHKTVNVSSECLKENAPITETVSIDALNLCTLVKNCNQLKISSDNNEKSAVSVTSNEKKWWKSDMSQTKESREPRNQSQTGSSCSQQALNPPCDVTIDELASYFETLVHIPKKMSSMAEMMYI